MTIEEIIQAWKAEKREKKPNQSFPENPAGHELSEEELEEVFGREQEAVGVPTDPVICHHRMNTIKCITPGIVNEMHF